jgi:predicted nucleotidyltransferase
VKLDLARDTVFVALAGSQAHGTARAGSDVDLRGVCVAPLELRVSPFREFEQLEGALDATLWAVVQPKIREHPTARFGVGIKTEAVVFDVAKFLSLCASANPNALEILFADERDWVYVTPAWQRIYTERRRFLSREVQQTYLGYALSQLSGSGRIGRGCFRRPSGSPREPISACRTRTP